MGYIKTFNLFSALEALRQFRFWLWKILTISRSISHVGLNPCYHLELNPIVAACIILRFLCFVGGSLILDHCWKWQRKLFQNFWVCPDALLSCPKHVTMNKTSGTDLLQFQAWLIKTLHPEKVQSCGVLSSFYIALNFLHEEAKNLVTVGTNNSNV